MKHLLAILVFALTLPAFAADSNGSQYQWQTPADKWEVTPELSYNSMKVTLKPSGDVTIKGAQQSVKGEYGISEMFSTGLVLTNSSVSTTYPTPPYATGTKDSEMSGLHDLEAFFHGRMPMGPGSFRFGADVNFALSKQEVDATGRVSNNASGGMGLKPFVGYEMTKDTCTLGARLSYKMSLGDRSKENVAPTAESKLSGAEQTALNLFFEHDMKPMILGAALEVLSKAKEEDKIGTVTTKAAGYTSVGLKLYAPYMVTDTITVLPAFTYAKYTAVDTENIDSQNQWTLAVGGRFQF